MARHRSNQSAFACHPGLRTAITPSLLLTFPQTSSWTTLAPSSHSLRFVSLSHRLDPVSAPSVRRNSHKALVTCSQIGGGTKSWTSLDSAWAATSRTESCAYSPPSQSQRISVSILPRLGDSDNLSPTSFHQPSSLLSSVYNKAQSTGSMVTGRLLIPSEGTHI